MKLLVIAAVLVALSVPAWAINKCTGPDGKVVYQDAPCEGGAKVNLGGAGQANPNSSGANYWKLEVLRQEREEKVKQAIANAKVFIGMTADEVRQSWGKATVVNRSITAGGNSEQWVYRRRNTDSQYVYLRNGIVDSMQSPE